MVLLCFLHGNRTYGSPSCGARCCYAAACNCRPLRFVMLAVSSTGCARNLTHHPLQYRTTCRWSFYVSYMGIEPTVRPLAVPVVATLPLATADRCASLCSLYHPPDVLATSPITRSIFKNAHGQIGRGHFFMQIRINTGFQDISSLKNRLKSVRKILAENLTWFLSWFLFSSKR